MQPPLLSASVLIRGCPENKWVYLNVEKFWWCCSNFALCFALQKVKYAMNLKILNFFCSPAGMYEACFAFLMPNGYCAKSKSWSNCCCEFKDTVAWNLKNYLAPMKDLKLQYLCLTARLDLTNQIKHPFWIANGLPYCWL